MMGRGKDRKKGGWVDDLTSVAVPDPALAGPARCSEQRMEVPLFCFCPPWGPLVMSFFLLSRAQYQSSFPPHCPQP